MSSSMWLICEESTSSCKPSAVNRLSRRRLKLLRLTLPEIQSVEDTSEQAEIDLLRVQPFDERLESLGKVRFLPWI